MNRTRTIGIQTSPGSAGWASVALTLLLAGLGLACDRGADKIKDTDEQTATGSVTESIVTPDPQAVALAEKAAALFGPLPESAPNPKNVETEAKIDLGRMLYYDPRLSKNHDIACNSCHPLDHYGVDGEKTSPGHRGQRGVRNSPSVYNAAFHVAQFWDGREPDVEAQAKGPVLNPVEMASQSPERVVEVIASIPGYVEAFEAAFPDEAQPVSYDNMARAIGAFERKLVTPGRFDAFMKGDPNALTATEQRGLETFISVGCNSCHMGPTVGGTLYRKLGFIFPYETADPGRQAITGDPADLHVFKVPSLRNVAMTAPYFSDGSIPTLAEVVPLMAYHQIGVKLEPAQVADIVAFLGSLTGEVDEDYIAKPTLPANGPRTPAPDPS